MKLRMERVKGVVIGRPKTALRGPEPKHDVGMENREGADVTEVRYRERLVISRKNFEGAVR